MTITYESHHAPIPGALRDELYALVRDVFETAERHYFEWPVQNMPDLTIHVARDGGVPVGFKIGHAEGATRYYSWLGGVALAHRKQGIARELMQMQHAHARRRGYTSIRTGLAPENTAMRALNDSFGFRMMGQYDRGDGPRILFILDL